jgi:hypothetical protein
MGSKCRFQLVVGQQLYCVTYTLGSKAHRDCMCEDKSAINPHIGQLEMS